MLLYTVLAVVYSGLLVSARPENPGRYYDSAQVTGASYDDYEQHEDSQVGGHNRLWASDASQYILGTRPQQANGGYLDQQPAPFPDAGRGRWPEPPHHLPGPPKRPHDIPKPPGPPPPGKPQHPPPEPNHPHPERPHHPFPEPHQPPHDPPEGPPQKGPFPHFPKPDHDTKDKTIYQFLEGHPKFSRLFKLVNFTQDITNLLNDSSQSVTLFALPDWAFPKPPHPHHGGPKDTQLEDLFQTGGSPADMLAATEVYLSNANNPDDDKIKQFLKHILLYNILPEKTSLSQLQSNHTFATSLKLVDGSLDGEPLRIRAGKGLGLNSHLTINIVSKVLAPDIPTQNGVIHVVDKPVLPPPSIFQIAFLLSDAFSTFSSAIQRVGLIDALDFHGGENGAGAVSLFAPDNKAFSRLPPGLKHYLFSPFGEKALKKLLQFHIVPQAVLHSNYYHNASHSEFVASHHDVATEQIYLHLDHSSQDWTLLEDSQVQEPRYVRKESGREHDQFRSKPHHLPPPPGCFPNNHGPEPSFPPPPPPPHVFEDYPPPVHFSPPPPHHGSEHLPPPPPHFPPPPPPHSHHEFEHWPPPPPGHFPPPPHHGSEHLAPPPPHFPPPSPPPVHFPPPPPPPHFPPPVHPPLPPPHHSPEYPLPPPWYPPPPPPHHGPEHQPPPPGHFPPPLNHPLPPPPQFPPPPGDCPPPPPPPHHQHHYLQPAPPKDGPHHPHRPPAPGDEPHHPPSPGDGPRRPPPPPIGDHHHPRPKVVFSVNATVPSLLKGHPLEVKIAQVAFGAFSRGEHHEGRRPKHVLYKTVLAAQGQPVTILDLPARNGVIHVIPRLLNPFPKPHHRPHGDEPERDGPEFLHDGSESFEYDEWAGWEEWLPRWAEE